MDEFLIFAAVGFLAQLVDGALGMAYGVMSATALLAFGVPPANASASVHAAKLFTTAASGLSHWGFGNIDARLFWRLAPAGVAGGALGVVLLTAVDGAAIRPFVVAYLAVMGLVIIWRTLGYRPNGGIASGAIAPLGAAGGFADAIGGGGWGPVVATTLVGAGETPRFVVGSVNSAEFVVTVGIVASFVVAFASGVWEEAGGLTERAMAIAGLIVGGLLAAPFAGWLVRIAPARVLGVAVGLLVLALSLYQLWSAWG